VDSTGWEVVQDRARQHALWRWRSLILEMFEVCAVGQELLSSCLEAAGDAKLRQVLADTFAGKANSTLNKRAASMIKYISWCRSEGLPPFPLEETTAYGYVSSLAGGAASTARSFVQALNFCKGVLGLQGVSELMRSRRIAGSAQNQYTKKPPLEQRDPLTLSQVQALESMACKAPSCQDRAAAGAFCFMLYSRARMSDLNCIRELSFELAADGRGFVEAKALGNKTATTQEKKARFLPVTAVVEPLSSGNWAIEWQKSRALAGLNNHRFLLPAPTAGGGWCSRPLTSGEACRWLKDLLGQVGCIIEGQKLGTHSCKVTLL
jgi:hypothetical protein